MAFPTKTIYSSNNTASPLTLNIGSPASGDLLICMVTGSGSDIPDLPSGYTSFNTQSRSGAGPCGYRGFYKVCDGTEGATVSVTKAGSPTFMGGIVYKIATGTYTGTPEGTSSNVNNTAVDPPVLTPSWGSFDTLWIAGMYNASSLALVAEPSDSDAAYAGTLTNVASRMYSEHAEKTTASENPPTYTLQFAQGAIPFTVAIRGVSGGGTVRRRVMLKQPTAPTKAKISKISKLLAGISLIFNPDSGTPPAISTDKKFWWFRRRKR